MSSSQPETDSRPKPGLAILIAISAIGPIALNIFIPSMPGLRAALNADHVAVQLTLTLYLVALACAQLVVGPLSDRLGRRPVVLGGTALFVLASLYCAFASSLDQLLVGRVVQAAGGCAGVALARAILRDLYERDQAASLLGYVTMAMAVAPMVSPAIGGVLDTLAGWRASFFAVAAVGALVLVLSMRHLHETHHHRGIARHGNFLSDAAALLKRRAFVGYALNSAFGSSAFFAFIAGVPFIVTEVMRLSAATYGLYFILVSLGYIAGNFLSGRFSTKFGTVRMLTAGSVLASVGASLMLGLAAIELNHPLALFLPMMVIAVSNGLTIPNATAGAVSVRPDIAGSAAGLVGFLQIGVGAVATVFVGLLFDGTSLPTTAIVAASIAASVAMLFLVRGDRTISAGVGRS